jgi:hypothetical protein
MAMSAIVAAVPRQTPTEASATGQLGGTAGLSAESLSFGSSEPVWALIGVSSISK